MHSASTIVRVPLLSVLLMIFHALEIFCSYHELLMLRRPFPNLARTLFPLMVVALFPTEFSMVLL